MLQEWWRKLDEKPQNGAIFYFVLALMWIGVSIALNTLRFTKNGFDLRLILEMKILWVGVVFLGRYLFFSSYRFPKVRIWGFLLIFIIILTATILSSWNHSVNFWFWPCMVLDTLLWTFFSIIPFEVVVAIFGWWLKHPVCGHPSELSPLWEQLALELCRMGFWLMLLFVLIYFYLASFYIIDTVLYSYLGWALLFIAGAWLYDIRYQMVNTRIRGEVNRLDCQLAEYPKWGDINREEFTALLSGYQYLLLTREYWLKFKPPVLVKVWVYYLCYTIIILSLPYWFGIVG